MGRAGSFGMGKLESLELPDALSAIAMLHDMQPEQRAAQMPTLPRAASGLESMQSIEQVCLTYRILSKCLPHLNQSEGTSV